jgi:hypothetical protein
VARPVLLRAFRRGLAPGPCRGLNKTASAARRLRRCSTSSGAPTPAGTASSAPRCSSAVTGASVQAPGSRCRCTSCPAPPRGVLTVRPPQDIPRRTFRAGGSPLVRRNRAHNRLPAPCFRPSSPALVGERAVWQPRARIRVDGSRQAYYQCRSQPRHGGLHPISRLYWPPGARWLAGVASTGSNGHTRTSH